MQLQNVTSFWESLRESRLLTPEQWARAQRDAPATSEPRFAAQFLVQLGWLTRWQAQQLLEGQTSFFLGKYKLLSRLSSGSQGTVYKAEQLGLGRTVVLKVFAAQVARSSSGMIRFRREIEALAGLEHPHIMSILDADQADGRAFYVMEYCRGRDLQAWLDEFGRLPIDWACEVIRQAALGLQHAHERGLVHRDIKPGNLLILAEDTSGVPFVKILDLGIARAHAGAKQTALTQADRLLGTVDYMAPEQARDPHNVDIRADIYSLGCTLYQALTGEIPFSGTNAAEKLRARLLHQCKPARALREEIPPDLETLIGLLLSQVPQQRPARPQAVADSLAPFARSFAGGPSSSLFASSLFASSPLANPSVDLLERVCLPRDIRSGNWRWESRILISFPEMTSRISFPTSVPDEYLLEIMATRVAGQGPLTLGLSLPSGPCVVRLEDARSSSGRRLPESAQSERSLPRRPRLFRNGWPCRIQCEVRRNFVSVTCDDREIIQLHIDAPPATRSPSVSAAEDESIASETSSKAETASEAGRLFLQCGGKYHLGSVHLFPLTDQPRSG